MGERTLSIVVTGPALARLYAGAVVGEYSTHQATVVGVLIVGAGIIPNAISKLFFAYLFGLWAVAGFDSDRFASIAVTDIGADRLESAGLADPFNAATVAIAVAGGLFIFVIATRIPQAIPAVLVAISIGLALDACRLLGIDTEPVVSPITDAALSAFNN